MAVFEVGTEYGSILVDAANVDAAKAKWAAHYLAYSAGPATVVREIDGAIILRVGDDVQFHQNGTRRIARVRAVEGDSAGLTWNDEENQHPEAFIISKLCFKKDSPRVTDNSHQQHGHYWLYGRA